MLCGFFGDLWLINEIFLNSLTLQINLGLLRVSSSLCQELLA